MGVEIWSLRLQGHKWFQRRTHQPQTEQRTWDIKSADLLMGPPHYIIIIIIASSPPQLSAAHNTVLKVHNSQRYISDPDICNETRKDGSSISGCFFYFYFFRFFYFFYFFFFRFFEFFEFFYYSTHILWSSLGWRCPPQPLLLSLRIVLHTVHTHTHTRRSHKHAEGLVVLLLEVRLSFSVSKSSTHTTSFTLSLLAFYCSDRSEWLQRLFSFTFCVALLLYCLNAARLSVTQLCLLEVVGGRQNKVKVKLVGRASIFAPQSYFFLWGYRN